MKIEFEYGGVVVDIFVDPADEYTEINPVPILKALQEAYMAMQLAGVGHFKIEVKQ
jgi:hypothetical protein